MTTIEIMRKIGGLPPWPWRKHEITNYLDWSTKCLPELCNEIDQLRQRAEAAEQECEKYKAWYESTVKGAFNGMQIQAADCADLRHRAEAAEKELANFKAKVQPLVDAAREALHLCQIKRVFTSEHHEIDKSQAATWLANALQQWDKSQNQSSNARAIDLKNH